MCKISQYKGKYISVPTNSEQFILRKEGVALNPENNKFLKLKPGVVRTYDTDIVIMKLDPYFEEKNHVAYVTSILRLPEDQLRIIQNYAKQYGVDAYYPEIINCEVYSKIIANTKEVYSWQRAWSRLLNKGVIINPPLEAECLQDYYKNGINKKGQIIPPSVHFLGKAFDIGGMGGEDKTPSDELEIISGAMAQDPDLGIKDFLLERQNNCLHCNIK